ncbi:helix-turn-helix domain-containing protein [Paenibacillus chitinolyticus]
MIKLTNIRHDRLAEWYEESGPGGNTAASLIMLSYGRCLYWIENDKIMLEKGDLLLIREGVTYYGKSIPTFLHNKYVASFHLTDTGHKLPLLNKPWIKIRSGMAEFLLERTRKCYSDWKENEPYAAIRGQAILLEMLALLSREADQAAVSSETGKHAERMKQYIRDHYREKVTKDQLSEFISKSPNYTAALFKKVTGQTISEYVHSVRVKKAVYMLMDSLLTIAEIAEFVGYEDVSYFQRIFKKTTGRTPSSYMKERPPRN